MSRLEQHKLTLAFWKSYDGSMAEEEKKHPYDDESEEPQELIEKIIEEVEERDKREGETPQWEQELPELIVKVVHDVSLQASKDFTVEEQRSIKQKEKDEAVMLMDILLSPKDTKIEKQKMVAAVLENYLTEDDIQTAAVRQKFLRYAETAGLDPLAIQVEQATINQEQETEPLGHDLDQIEMNSFEKLVEKQITEANIDEVKEIQRGWLKIIGNKHFDESIREQAKEAVKVLGDIVKVKEMKEKRERGEHVDPRTLPPPQRTSSENTEKNEQTDDVQSVIAETEAIAVVDSKEQLTTDRYEQYLNNLKKALEEEALTEQQILDAFYAVDLQGVFFGETSLKKELVDKAKTVKELLWDKKRKMGDEEKRPISERNVFSHLEKIGYETSRRMKFANRGGGSPIQTEGNQRYNIQPTIIGEIEDGKTLVEQISQVTPDVLPVAHLPAQIQSNARQEFQQRIATFGDKKFYGNEEALVSEMRYLESEIRRAQEAGTSLRELTGARTLAENLMRQQLAVRNVEHGGYKGKLDEHSQDTKDDKLYPKYVHQALEERMKRILNPVDEKGHSYSDEQLLSYYKEIQKWVSIVLKNDITNNPDKADNNALRLSSERYNAYDNIKKTEITLENIQRNKNTISQQIQDLYKKDANGIDFLRYFKQDVLDPINNDELLGVPYERPDEAGEYSIPKSLHETMRLIANQYSNPEVDYKTGGNKELLDAEGNFNYNNFYYWIHDQTLKDMDYNSDSDINPFDKLTINLPMGQISLYQLLLLIPEYLSERHYEIKQKDGQIYSGWGEKKEHEGLKWDYTDYIAGELQLRSMYHGLRSQYVASQVSASQEKYIEIMNSMFKSNGMSRSNNIFWFLGFPSAVANGMQEIEDCFGEKQAQGTIGKSVSDMIVGYNYITEISKFHQKEETDENGNVKYDSHGHAKMVEKNFNDNMFYKFWEPNGANTFLISMAEGALGHQEGAKKLYGDFIKERVDYAAQACSNKNNLTSVQQARLDHLVKLTKDKIKSPTISFTENKQLEEFLYLIQKDVLQSTEDKKSLQKRLKEEVKGDIVNHLKDGYFAKLLEMKVDQIKGDNKGKPATSTTDGLYLLDIKAPKVTFGELEIGGGLTMKKLLERFDPKQITQFDYETSDTSNPSNPFHSLHGQDLEKVDKKILRQLLDNHMHHKNKNHDLFKDNERMMLAFLKYGAHMQRADINHFRVPAENVRSRDLVKNSMQKMTEKLRGIDNKESLYAWTMARDLVFLWGVASRLDDGSVGFRFDKKIFDTAGWRARRGGKDTFGNEFTVDEIGAIAVPFLDALQARDQNDPGEFGARSIFSLMQGGEGGDITARAIRKFSSRGDYYIKKGADHDYVGNMLVKGGDLLNLISRKEFDFTKIVAFDHLGNVVFDREKAIETFKKWRDGVRYGFEKNDIDYRRKIWINGKETTLYKYFFGPKTRAINSLITKVNERTDNEHFTMPGDAVMMTIFAAEVFEHRKAISNAHHWTIDQIMAMETMLITLLTEGMLHEEYGERKFHEHHKQLVNHEIVAGALKAYNTAYHKMYLIEANSTFWKGAFDGLGAGIRAFFSRSANSKWIW